MVAPSTMSLLLITLLVNQSYGATFFKSFFDSYPCPALTKCDLTCPEGYETTIFSCAICKCRIDRCKDYPCGAGSHCEPSLRMGWFVVNRPHCIDNNVDYTIISRPATTTQRTTTTTQTPPGPKIQICQYGEAVSQCNIKSPCSDSIKYKCVILSSEGNGVCCLNQPLEPVTVSPSSHEMPRCMQVPDVGPCRSIIPRYYYNVTTERCQVFTYGGCRENENNFVDMNDCQNTCENPCKMVPNAGRCRAAIVRYYFNSTIGACQSFTFGGCQGNGNNWRTYDECRQKCDVSSSSKIYIDQNEIYANKP